MPTAPDIPNSAVEILHPFPRSSSSLLPVLLTLTRLLLDSLHALAWVRALLSSQDGVLADLLVGDLVGLCRHEPDGHHYGDDADERLCEEAPIGRGRRMPQRSAVWVGRSRWRSGSQVLLVALDWVGRLLSARTAEITTLAIGLAACASGLVDQW